MFQWKERCVRGKCGGRGGTYLIQSQKKHKGCVSFVAYFPLWSELSTWKHKADIAPGLIEKVLGLRLLWCAFWTAAGLVRPGAPCLGHQQNCRSHGVKITDAVTFSLVNLVVIVWENLSPQRMSSPTYGQLHEVRWVSSTSRRDTTSVALLFSSS